MTKIDWRNIERRLGLRDAERFAKREIIPQIEEAPVEALKKNGERENRLEKPMSIAFLGFCASFLIPMFFLPDTWWGVTPRFLLFFPLFMAWMGGAIFLYRERFVEALTNSQSRYVLQAKALTTLAENVGLTYVPSPGGAPESLKWLARRSWAPDRLREAAILIDKHGGMDDAVKLVRQSGVMIGGAHFVGDDEARTKYHRHQTHNAQIEDGFQGVRNGVSLNAFEWVERVEDGPDIYHLAMAFISPRRLHGVTQLRSRHINWPFSARHVDMKSVGVVAPAFESRFRMRSTDQVEARAVFDPVVLERMSNIAHGEKVRAVAFEDHLIVDVEGENRFSMVNLMNGEWSEETVARSMINLAEMLELADAVAHVFKLRTAA
ncbi:MAG: DUF3137 domain-containing protein [Pseudomonadota bacterium]